MSCFNPLISGMGNGSNRHERKTHLWWPNVSIRLLAAWGMEEVDVNDSTPRCTGFNPLISGMGNGSHLRAAVYEYKVGIQVSIRLLAAWGMEVSLCQSKNYFHSFWFQSAYQRHGEWKNRSLMQVFEQEVVQFQSAYQRHGEWKKIPFMRGANPMIQVSIRLSAAWGMEVCVRSPLRCNWPMVSIRLSAAWGMEAYGGIHGCRYSLQSFNPLISGMGNGSGYIWNETQEFLI